MIKFGTQIVEEIHGHILDTILDKIPEKILD